jgi:4-aminobutyrate aminotransferase-like enzyme
MISELQRAHLRREQQHLCSGVSEEASLAPRVYASGSGDYLRDLDGAYYIDLAAGILTQTVGHCHPHVVAAMRAQIEQLWNVHDCSTPVRADLCDLLAQWLPGDLDTFCFLSTGAEAVEAAIRAVWSVAAPKRNRLAALRHGFHGKTQGARGLVHWDVGYHSFSGNSVLGYSPYCYRCPLGLKYPDCELQCAKLAARHIARDNVAALFFEPIQGAAGVIVPPPGYWQVLQNACRDSGVLLVADEIITGGGRVGTFLACTRLQIEPDLVVMAKGMSSGFPFAVLAGKAAIINSPLFGEAGSSSSTYASNPLGIAAAKATLEVIEREQLIPRVASLETAIRARLLEWLQRFECVGDVRGMGLLYGIEFVSNKTTREPAPAAARAIFKRCLDIGLRVCLGGHTLRLAPPFNISQSNLSAALNLLEQAIGWYAEH